MAQEQDINIAAMADGVASGLEKTVQEAQLRDERDVALRALAEAEEQLRSLEQMQLAFFSNCPVGICLIADRKVYFVNTRLCEMLGCEAEALIGTDVLQYVADSDRARTARVYERMIGGGDFPRSYETVLLTPAGEPIKVRLHADRAQLRGQCSLILRIRDISAQEKVQRMAVENERLAAILTVAHGVGSNFANALGVIRTHAATIADSFLPSTRPHEAARQVLEAAEHAAELTKRLLSVVRMSGPDAGVQVEAVSLGVTIRKARDLLAAGLEKRDIQLVMAPDPRPWYALADAGQLLDVLMNIILNAAEAMPQGGVISIEMNNMQREQTDEGGQRMLRDYICVAVRDTGEGMTPEDITKVFAPFYTTRSDPYAFGLGLPVAQQMLKRWGGEIEISSVVGEGTTVHLLLPQALDMVNMGTSDQPGMLDGRILLVVEDNAAHRQMMVDALRESGFSILEAETGEQAVERYRAHPEQIALTILDWMLPGLDGGMVLQTIQETDPDARILLISGFSKDYVRSQIKRGAWAFLQKPFSGADLHAAVLRTLPPPRCLLPPTVA